MKEYRLDSLGFYDAHHFQRTEQESQPIEEVDGTVVFDGKREHAKRAENRQRVEEWNRRLPARGRPRRRG
ncbi:MAG: hypothetical protein M3Q10_00140 [Chloroflexota bacterium]|nr:hypothetical protein [Chloroflexota bacterium]